MFGVMVTHQRKSVTMLDKAFLKGAIGALKDHPEALLAFVMAVLAVGLLLKGYDPYIAVGVPGIFYLGYLLRVLLQDRHRERLAKMDVESLESGKGKSIRARNIRAVTKTRAPKKGSRGSI